MGLRKIQLINTFGDVSHFIYHYGAGEFLNGGFSKTQIRLCQISLHSNNHTTSTISFLLLFINNECFSVTFEARAIGQGLEAPVISLSFVGAN
jgi:hypothetical protein